MSDFFTTMTGGTASPELENYDNTAQMAQLTNALQSYYPGLANEINQSSLNAQQQGFQQALGQAPQQAAQAFGLYNQYAPQLNALGQQMSASNQAAQLQSLSNLMNSPQAASTVNATNALQQSLNPQFYALRNQVGQGESALLNTLAPPGQLSGSTQAQISRGLNQMNYNAGNGNVGNPLTTLQNAQNFGTGLQQQQQFQSGLFGQAANTGQATQSGLSAFGLVNPSLAAPTQFGSSNAGSLQNTAQGQTPTISGMSGLGTGLASGLFGSYGGLMGNINSANANTYATQMSGQTGSANTGQSAMGSGQWGCG